MRKSNIIQIIALIIIGAIELLHPASVYPDLRFIVSFINIAAFFIWPGFLIAFLMQCIRRKEFTVWEFMTISSVNSLVLVPLLLLLENFIIGRVYSWLPLLNTAGLALILMKIQASIKKDFVGWNIIQNRIKQNNVFKSVWFWSFLIFSALVVRIATTYETLPELDPYYWLEQYRIVTAELPSFIGQNRELFYSLNYIFIEASGVDSYGYFKYVLPLLSVFTLFPVALVATRYKNRLIQAAIFAIPLFCPSTFLYTQVPFPQAISITLVYYFLFLIVYSRQTGKRIFYYFAGALVLVSYLYHQVGIIIFFVWLLVTLLNNRQDIYVYLKNNRLVSGLLGIIILSNIHIFQHPISFITNWVSYILNRIAVNTNLKFPAHYINVDGQDVGWAGIQGVTKYYLYYVGPVFLAACGIFLFLSIRNRTYRTSLRYAIAKSAEIQTLIACFFLFFIISEVLPRALNIALLPERAWGLAGIFLSYGIIHLLNIAGRYSRHIAITILILTCVSVGAAVYINNLKKHVRPDYQLQSARWIQNNLPPDRVMVTTTHGDFLKFHAASQIISVQEGVYCDTKMTDSNNLIRTIKNGVVDSSPRSIIVQNAVNSISSYLHKTSIVSTEEATSLITPYISQINISDEQLRNSEDSLRKNMYIYYAKVDEANPYNNRPYTQGSGGCEDPVFLHQPEMYVSVYNDGNKVIIWKVK